MECAGPSTVVFDPTLTEYDFGAAAPDGAGAGRPDHAAGRRARRHRPRLRVVPAPMADDDLIATVHDAALIEAVQRAGHPVRAELRWASAPTTTRCSSACTRRRRTWWAPASRRSGRCGRGSRSTAPTSPAGCTTRCPTGPAASASTTTSRSASSGCSTRAPSGSPTSTSTCTTATASRRSSGTTRGCSPSPCTSPASSCSPAPASPRTPAARTRRARRSTSPCRPARRRRLAARVPRGGAALVREFAPDVLVTQHGCDSHAEDPLADLMLSVDGQRAAYLALHELAHEVCDGRWVATGGGGYALVDVVPRAWTHLLGVVAGRPLDPETATPGGWRARPRAPRGGGAGAAHRRPRPGVPPLGGGLRPGLLAGPAGPQHPERGLPAARARSAALSRASRRKPTRRVPIVNFWRPFPTSHSRPYSHHDVHV